VLFFGLFLLLFNLFSVAFPPENFSADALERALTFFDSRSTRLNENRQIMSNSSAVTNKAAKVVVKPRPIKQVIYVEVEPIKSKHDPD